MASLCLGLASCTHYVYEESYALEADGAGTVRISASDVLWHEIHGLGTTPEDVGLPAIRKLLDAPSLRVESATETERSGERYLHTQIRFSSLNTLCRLPALAGRGCKFEVFEDRVEITGNFGRPDDTTNQPDDTEVQPGASSDERVAFRFHVPSIVRSHNAVELERGNILRWETDARAYLSGEAIWVEAELDPESIMAITVKVILISTAIVFALIVTSLALVYRKGVRQLEAEKQLSVNSNQ